jgi:ketosteroid isomerase-like protein
MHIGEWIWRFIAVAMLVMVGWMGWVIYLLNSPPLVTAAAFEASAKAKAQGSPHQQTTGTITPAAPAPAGAASGPAEAPKPAAAVAEAPKPVAEAPKPVAEAPKPAPAPAQAKPNPADILEVLEAWARAWSTKDADAYLALYAKDFKVPGGETREAWEKGRRARIAAPKSISVTVDAPKIEIQGDDRASVTFRQQYKSDIVASAAMTKTLALVRVDGRWLIQQETTGN